MSFGGGHFERKKALSDYIAQKILMIENEFYIKLSYEDIIHMKSLKTEAAVDQYAHHILVNRL